MSTRNPRRPSPPKVVLREPFTPEPLRAPEIPAPGTEPKVIIFPPGQSAKDRDAFMRELVRDHGDFLHRLLAARKDLLPESAKDINQRVLLIVCHHQEQRKPMPNVRGFLVEAARREIANHNRTPRPPFAGEAELDEAASPDTSPEGRAAAAEQRAKLARYLDRLPEEEQEVVRAVDLLGLTLEEAAAALGRPRTTVARRHDRAVEKLCALAAASERATDLGARRR